MAVLAPTTPPTFCCCSILILWFSACRSLFSACRSSPWYNWYVFIDYTQADTAGKLNTSVTAKIRENDIERSASPGLRTPMEIVLQDLAIFSSRYPESDVINLSTSVADKMVFSIYDRWGRKCFFASLNGSVFILQAHNWLKWTHNRSPDHVSRLPHEWDGTKSELWHYDIQSVPYKCSCN